MRAAKNRICVSATSTVLAIESAKGNDARTHAKMTVTAWEAMCVTLELADVSNFSRNVSSMTTAQRMRPA